MHARLLLLAPLVTLGCGDDAPAVTVDEMGIQAFAVAGPLGDVELEVTFTTQASPTEVTFASLEDGDELAAILGGAEIILREEIEGDVARYRGSFAEIGDRVLTIELRRSNDDDTRSTVTIPSPHNVLSPPTTHTRGSDLTVNWDVTGEVGTTRILLAGPCVGGSEVRIDADPGTATIPAAAFDAPAGAAPSCTATIQVDRLSDGTADDDFGRGGRVEAVQTRPFSIDISD